MNGLQKDDLHELIHSMDPHEKGYFKKYTQLHGNASDNNYILLFDILNKQTEYNEPQILQKFKGQKFVRQLAVAKHYLYELVLRSLRAYHENQSALAKMNSWIENASILFSKGMYDQAMKMIAKCKEMVKELDDPVRELEIHYWERKYIGELKASGMEERMAQSFLESYASIDRLRDHLLLRNRYFDFLWIIRTDMTLRDSSLHRELQRLIDLDLLQKKEEELDGFYQKLGYFNSWNIYHFLSGNKESAYEYIRKIIDLWNEHPSIREQNFDLYIAGLNNFVVNCLATRKLDELSREIKRIDAIEPTSTNLRVKMFENAAMWKLAQGMMNGDDQYLVDLYEPLEKQLGEYESMMHEARVLTLKFSLALSYFFTMRYDLALKKINELLNEKRVELRRDLQANTRMLNLLVHYELGNEDLLEYIFRSTKRYLEGRENFYELEKMLFTALNKLSRSFDSKSKKEIFIQLKTDLEILSSNDQERSIINLLDIMDWVDSGIEGIPLVEAFRRRGATIKSKAHIRR